MRVIPIKRWRGEHHKLALTVMAVQRPVRQFPHIAPDIGSAHPAVLVGLPTDSRRLLTPVSRHIASDVREGVGPVL